MNIFIFGPSCSGKSSLSQFLYEQLGEKWTYLDRDDLIEKENVPEEHADKEIDNRLESKSKFIVDAQIPWRDKKIGELYFLVFPPLEILIHRDEKRTKDLLRTDEQAFWARSYVIETYNKLLQRPQVIFHDIFDSSKQTLEVESKKIISYIANYNT